MTPTADDSDAAAVTRLLHLARQRGFTFTPTGEEGSLWGERVTQRWRDIVFLGAGGHCNAARCYRSVAPSEPAVAEGVSGTALTVLHTVVYSWPT
ncbi:MAG: hypothetical protein JO272_14385 [Pseudonocardiales bacterium]|nr:hypothetical protein [Pseudonocardiales bacterium]